MTSHQVLPPQPFIDHVGGTETDFYLFVRSFCHNILSNPCLREVFTHPVFLERYNHFDFQMHFLKIAFGEPLHTNAETSITAMYYRLLETEVMSQQHFDMLVEQFVVTLNEHWVSEAAVETLKERVQKFGKVFNKEERNQGIYSLIGGMLRQDVILQANSSIAVA